MCLESFYQYHPTCGCLWCLTEHVILFRLRTGHNRLNTHMYNKFKVGESEMCPCNADIMTAEHLLQHCRLHDAMRWDTWPEPMPLRDKLYGNLEELRRTAAFVRTTGTPSSVRRRRRRRCLPKGHSLLIMRVLTLYRYTQNIKACARISLSVSSNMRLSLMSTKRALSSHHACAYIIQVYTEH